MWADAAAIVSTITKAVGAVEAAISVGKDIAPFITAIKDTLSGAQVTQADLDVLESRIDALSSELQQPLPDGA